MSAGPSGKRRKQSLKAPRPSRLSGAPNGNGAVTTHPYSSGSEGNRKTQLPTFQRERRLTERDMLRLQGFAGDYRPGGSYRQARRRIGNAAAIPSSGAAKREERAGTAHGAGRGNAEP